MNQKKGKDQERSSNRRNQIGSEIDQVDKNLQFFKEDN